jgi:hypothetical protein
MPRFAAGLLVLGVICYIVGPLMLHFRTSPIMGYATGDVMFGLVTLGTLLIVLAVMILHRRHLKQKQLDNG